MNRALICKSEPVANLGGTAEVVFRPKVGMNVGFFLLRGDLFDNF